MSPELLKLHIAQLSRAFEKSKTNTYADSRKQKYHIKLVELFSKIKQEDISKYDYDQQKNLKEVLDFIFHSIEFLDNSTLTSIPHEIVFCLESALRDWDTTEGYIIVTSLQNNISGYSFDPILALSPHYYDILNAMFDFHFEHKLIQINLPKYLVNDYLANVILYHELGHFIEEKYKISARLTNLKLNLGLITSEEDAVKHYHHISEYFADIFAAQYIGEASNYYLDYIAHKHSNSKTHPSTDSRINIVKDFLTANNSNEVLNDILAATEATTKQKLKIRFQEIQSSDFENFIPVIIPNLNSLHSIFIIGWNLWQKDISSFIINNIDDSEKYVIINNLIEKSISNYMVLEKWEK